MRSGLTPREQGYFPRPSPIADLEMLPDHIYFLKFIKK
jgi:hypothetical protein